MTQISEHAPIVLVTGIAGDIGTALAAALEGRYLVVGLDVEAPEGEAAFLEVDLTQDHSVAYAMHRFRERYGGRIASVVHLAAYFDFTGQPNPLYEQVNVEGTRRLLDGLQDFEVEQFVYAGTMLVHEPVAPGERIDESRPVAPKWAYPESKAAAEAVIRRCHGDIPYVLLHLAGLYDDESAVPTLAQQIARIYERDLQSHLYSGDPAAGQSMLHKDDMVDAFVRAIDRRTSLPSELTLLVGEAEGVGYGSLQDRIGELIHGTGWATLQVPVPLAKAGAWVLKHAEPLVPDPIDKGEPPFIRPFMVEMAGDHYALDIARARELLDWAPRHDIRDALPSIVEALRRDPIAWYRSHGIVTPPWLESAAEKSDAPDALRERAQRRLHDQHHRNLWAPFLTVALGSWLLTSPPLLGYADTRLAWSDAASGMALMLLGALSLSPRLALLRWGSAAVGVWLMFAPLAFWTPDAAAYLNGTVIGALAVGFSVLARPPPGADGIALETGPTVPPGWSYSPSAWTQRLPIILLAFIGLYVSRYLTAYQLGHIDAVWDPFFAGAAVDPKNGTEEIITSSVSEAWPVPDAGLGAMTYLLEILIGMIGSARRWRTMPWLVVVFGIMIVPLGVVSVTFIIIQPILLGTWCTLCLIGAAAMLLQIPYSLDELVATGQFLMRRKRAGKSLLRVFFLGDTDDGQREPNEHEFDRPPSKVLRDVFGGGVGLPWNLLLCAAIGLWLMFTRLSLGASAAMADADHLIGALVLTVSISALAEVARPLRLLNIAFGITLLITPFAYDASLSQTVAGLACGFGLIAASLRRGPVRMRYGNWNRLIV